MPAQRTVLLADADVLIDYRDSELEILGLVARQVGRLVILAPVLDEVRGVTAAQCARLGIEVLDVETERMMEASAVESIVSFNDRLCLVVCRPVPGPVRGAPLRLGSSPSSPLRALRCIGVG